MGDSLEAYREAIATFVHTVCWDRNLDPDSTVNTEAGCRIERFLPGLVKLAKAVGPNDRQTFEAACERTLCVQCGELDARGVCPAQARAECCLYRYLPLIYDALCRVHAGAT